MKSLSCVRLFATPWTAAHQAPPSRGFSRQKYWSGVPSASPQASLPITNSQSPLKLMSIESVMPSNHLILCHSLLLPPSIFPSIRVFSNESVLHIRWPKYWSFSFRISPSIYCLYWNIFHILLSYIGNLANTAINIGVQMSFLISVFVSFGEIFRLEIAGLYGGSVFNFLKNLCLVSSVFHNGCLSLCSHPQCPKLPFFSHPWQHLLFIVFLIVAILISVR